MVKIIQSDNFAANFGFCLRSSSIFYIPPEPVSASIVVSNYWSFKNNLNVFLLVNWRAMDGSLVRRETVDFSDKNVSTLTSPSEFSGSCEVEAFSSQDLRIPYSAIMGVYETRESVSMVHSYSRTYSQIEIEDGRTISDGHEGCWVLRDFAGIRSFAVIHNGSEAMSAQEISLVVTNYFGVSKKVQWTEEAMNPFETRKIYPCQHFTDLIEFLGGQEGTCSIDYQLNKSFTRMLLGWESEDKSQLQVTHSNFNYSKHETDFVESKEVTAYMAIPLIQDSEIKVLVYPERSPGEYLMSSNKNEYHELPQTLVNPSYESADRIKFRKKVGKLPTRIVTAIQLKSPTDGHVIACECSLGVVHALRPPKRFHWGVWSARFNSRLLITAYPEIYGDVGNPQVVFKFYGEYSSNIAERKLFWEEISDDGVNSSLLISDICPDNQFKKDAYGYISIWSEFGGFLVFTTLAKHQSVSLEHTF